MIILLKLCVSIGLLAWLFFGMDVSGVGAVLASIPGYALAGAAAMILLQIPVLAFRWRSILQSLGEEWDWLTIFKATYIGIFFNQALPGSIGGDVVRTALLRGEGATLRTAASSVVLERLSGLYALALLLLVISPAVWPHLEHSGVIAITAVIAGLLTLGFVLLAYVDRLVPGWRRLHLARQTLAALREDYLVLLNDGRTTLQLMVLGVLSWSCNLTAIWLLAVGAGIKVPLLACYFLAGLSVLASVVPVSMAGWGVREGAMVALFGLLLVEPQQALSVSIAFGVLMLLTALPAVLVWLTSRSR